MQHISGCGFDFGAMADLAEEISLNQGGLRRSARLRKLKENGGKMVSQYFTEPTQSLVQIRLISKKGRGRKRQRGIDPPQKCA